MFIHSIAFAFLLVGVAILFYALVYLITIVASVLTSPWFWLVVGAAVTLYLLPKTRQFL